MYGGGPERCGLDIRINLPVEEAWKFPTGGKVRSSPVIAGGLAYVGSDSGRLFAVNLSTGARQWEADIGSRVRSAPAVADGIVVCGADDGVLRCRAMIYRQTIIPLARACGTGSFLHPRGT